LKIYLNRQKAVFIFVEVTYIFWKSFWVPVRSSWIF